MDSRTSVYYGSGLNVLAGIWLIIAPFALGYSADIPGTNDLWLGIVIGVLALVRLFAPLRSAWISWINAILGVWLVVAPFVLSYANNTPRVNDIVLGILVIAFSLWSGGAVATQRRGPAPA